MVATANSLFVGHVSKELLVILSAVENPDDDHLGFQNLEHDRSPPLEAHYPQTGADVVASHATLRKSFEPHACRLDSIDVTAGNLMAHLLGNVAIQVEQVGFC